MKPGYERVYLPVFEYIRVVPVLDKAYQHIGKKIILLRLPLVNGGNAEIEPISEFVSRICPLRIETNTRKFGESNSMGNYLSRTSEGRMRYTVRSGDTPAIIATRILGDVRYAGLLVTINRVSAVQDDNQPGAPVMFVPLSRIDLPSDSEMEIYSRHYFTAWTEKKSWLKESASSVSSFLERMRDAAHRGAERISTSNPISAFPHSKSNYSAEHRTAFNGASYRSISKVREPIASLAPIAPETPTAVMNQQRIFDAFINGAR